MTRYIALLRGINVGGNNIIDMKDLRSAFERKGFRNVRTYINSGNAIFDSDLDVSDVKSACEETIAEGLGLSIPVGVMTADEMKDAVEHAPEWWGKDPGSKHNAVFVIPPFTAADIMAEMGETKPEYERADYYGKVLFWSAPTETFSRTRLTKIVHSKAHYNAITVRNANTTKKLAVMVDEKGT
jgi:uncharacterized protein (DUF1697 family)